MGSGFQNIKWEKATGKLRCLTSNLAQNRAMPRHETCGNIFYVDYSLDAARWGFHATRETCNALFCISAATSFRNPGERHVEVTLLLVRLLKISHFVSKQLGSKASQVLRNQVCVFAWQKHQPVGGKKFEKLLKSHQFQATVELLIAFRCLPLNAQWLCHQKEGKSDLCRCWRCRRPEWSWDGLE